MMRSLAVAVVFILGTVVTGCDSGAVRPAEGSGDRTARPQSGERPPSLTTTEASEPPRENAETMPHGGRRHRRRRVRHAVPQRPPDARCGGHASAGGVREARA